MVAIMAALMYLIEGPESGFTSIPRSMYWAIVTMTTVGYGDISPRSPLGQFVASIVMIIGYGILAVPTGIFSVELLEASRRPVSTQACPSCAAEGHDTDARHCKFCGALL
jgi:voltage-gated potassium channel